MRFNYKGTEGSAVEIFGQMAVVTPKTRVFHCVHQVLFGTSTKSLGFGLVTALNG